MNTAKSRARIMVMLCFSLVAVTLAPPTASAEPCSYHVHLFLDLSKSVTVGGSASVYRETLLSLKRMMEEGGAFVNINYKLLVTPFGSATRPDLTVEAYGSNDIDKLLSSMIDDQPKIDSAQTDLVAVMRSIADEEKNPEAHEIVIIASDFAHDVGKGAKEDIADWMSRMNGDDGQSLRNSLRRRETEKRFSLLLFVAPALAEDLSRQRAILSWFLKEKIGDKVEITASRQEFEAVLAARLFPLDIRLHYIKSKNKNNDYNLVIRNHGCASCTIRKINLYQSSPPPNKKDAGTRTVPLGNVDLKPDSERSIPISSIWCPQTGDRYRIELLGEWGDKKAIGTSGRQEQLNRTMEDFLDCGNIVAVKGQVLDRIGQNLRVHLHLWGQIVDKASSYTLIVVNGQGNEVARRSRLRLPLEINTNTDGTEITRNAPLTNGVWTSWSLLADPLSVRLEGEGADPVGARSLMPMKRSRLLLPISPSVLRWIGAPAILWGLTFVLLTCFYRTTPTINNISSVVTLIWASYLFSIFNLAAEVDGDAPLWFMGFRPLISTWICLWIGILLSVGFGIPLLWERRSRAAWTAPLEENARELAREISNQSRSSGSRRGGSGLKFCSYGLRLLALAGAIVLFCMALRSIGAPPADRSSTVKEVRK
jgi:hypothetical protein